MIDREKVSLSPRGKIKNHVFQGVNSELRELVYSLNDVIVYFDPDVDGCISGYFICSFLSKLGKTFTWYINKNRSHDWSLPVKEVSGKDIIAVDFIVETSKILELCDAGCNIVSLDHHVNPHKRFLKYVSDYETQGYIINNQSRGEDEDGKYLSGAGVVFETLIALDPTFDTPTNRALVGITLLSDVRNIENPLAEGYLYTLYTHKYKGIIKYLIEFTMGEDYGFGVPRLDRNFVDYKLSPAINACLRFNQQDMVVNFFLGSGFLDLNYRKEQKELVKKMVEFAKIVDFSHLRVCYFYEKDLKEYRDVLSCFVGLLASRFLDGKHSVLCYMIGETNGSLCIRRASFRGRINGLNYQSALSEVIGCPGHESAFGVKGLVPVKSTFSQINKLCANLESSSNYKRTVIDVPNLSIFNARKVAEDNLYKLSQNKIYLRYTGNCVKKLRGGANYVEYSINGVIVKCFDLKKTVENSLIYPILDRGLLTFYLE